MNARVPDVLSALAICIAVLCLAGAAALCVWIRQTYGFFAGFSALGTGFSAWAITELLIDRRR